MNFSSWTFPLIVFASEGEPANHKSKQHSVNGYNNERTLSDVEPELLFLGENFI